MSQPTKYIVDLRIGEHLWCDAVFLEGNVFKLQSNGDFEYVPVNNVLSITINPLWKSWRTNSYQKQKSTT